VRLARRDLGSVESRLGMVSSQLAACLRTPLSVGRGSCRTTETTANIGASGLRGSVALPGLDFFNGLLGSSEMSEASMCEPHDDKPREFNFWSRLVTKSHVWSSLARSSEPETRNPELFDSAWCLVPCVFLPGARQNKVTKRSIRVAFSGRCGPEHFCDGTA
jgi:hypothetical protein